MTAIVPNSLFRVWSPDEVAECLDGVPQALYSRLWEFVAEYEDQPRSEVPDDFGRRCLARFWGKLTVDEQTQLNTLAEKQA